MKLEFYFEKLKSIFDRYEAKLAALALVLGFTFDYFTLQRVDFLIDNIFIILYLILSGLCIVILNLYEAGRWRNNFTENIYDFLPFLLQFAFGGLFSAFVIFYSKSAALFVSGPFVLILAILLIGNEFFKKRYSKLVFQIGIYFVAIFSFSIYFLPVLVKEMGDKIFVFSGLISLALVAIFIFIIFRLAPSRYRETERSLLVTVATLYAFINFLYLTNIIPPIPLSLRVGDVYHFAQKQSSGNYLLMGEKDTWWERLALSQQIHLNSSEPVYVFSSVFAPADLEVNIVHDWQYVDANGEWVSANQISFPIVGGRDQGYRAFSKKENVFPGKWRVDIKTTRGQVIGRVRFDILPGSPAEPLVTETV